MNRRLQIWGYRGIWDLAWRASRSGYGAALFGVNGDFFDYRYLYLAALRLGSQK